VPGEKSLSDRHFLNFSDVETLCRVPFHPLRRLMVRLGRGFFFEMAREVTVPGETSLPDRHFLNFSDFETLCRVRFFIYYGALWFD
jgi:hypothetical protein